MKVNELLHWLMRSRCDCPAAVLGMMGGVMLAFVAEFIAKAKANAAAKA